jgi:hypothetical protein
MGVIRISAGPFQFTARFEDNDAPMAGNHFLTIIEGAAQLKDLGHLVLYAGAQDISFEAIEETT